MAKFPPTGPVKGEDGWINRYTTNTFKLCRGVTLHVNWRSAREGRDAEGKYLPAGHDVCVLDRKLIRRFDSIDEAKAQAFRLARKIMKEMAEALDKPGPDGRSREFIAQPEVKVTPPTV
jgi:hypothetical protein